MILAIYLSGLIFFLAQAALYARLSMPRLLGAAVWPLAILCVPSIVSSVRYARSVGMSGGIVSIHWGYRGDKRGPENAMWGIGA